MGSFSTRFERVAENQDLTAVETDILVVPVFQEKAAEPSKPKGKPGKKSRPDAEEDNGAKLVWTPLHQSIDDHFNGYIRETLAEENFKADLAKKRIFRVGNHGDLKARWVVLVGMGTTDKLDINKATKALGAGLKDSYGFKDILAATVVLPDEGPKLSPVQALQAAVFSAIQSTYKTREAGEKKVHKLEQVKLASLNGRVHQEELDAAVAMAMAESFTKDLANMPANLKRAETLAEAARELAKLPNVSVEVIADLERIRTEMPAFWAVAQGAAHVDPPRFIKVTYAPSGKIKRNIALVGKGVIFDTGGVQVKTGNYMNDMKFDMTGAATVLGCIQAIATLKLKGIKVTAYIAATRNLIGEEAYLPDSIIDSANGKKIEIRHTDAEGRVTLADAVHYAVEDGPDEIVTIATLTGAAGIAVGNCIALMGSDDALLDRIEKRSKSVGETVQKLELLEEDFDNIKSDRDAADLSNTSKGRNRGHLTAGAFVMSFAGDVPIAHMDIAGGDAKDGNATGISVKGLIEYLRKEAS